MYYYVCLNAGSIIKCGFKVVKMAKITFLDEIF